MCACADTHMIHHKAPCCEGVHVQCVCTAVNSYSVCFTSTGWSRGIDYRRGNSFIPICWRASSNISLLSGKFLLGSRHCAKCYGPLNVVFQRHTSKWGLWELSKWNFNVLWLFLWRLVNGLEVDPKAGTRQGLKGHLLNTMHNSLVKVEETRGGAGRVLWEIQRALASGWRLTEEHVRHTHWRSIQKKRQSQTEDKNLSKPRARTHWTR